MLGPGPRMLGLKLRCCFGRMGRQQGSPWSQERHGAEFGRLGEGQPGMRRAGLLQRPAGSRRPHSHLPTSPPGPASCTCSSAAASALCPPGPRAWTPTLGLSASCHLCPARSTSLSTEATEVVFRRTQNRSFEMTRPSNNKAERKTAPQSSVRELVRGPAWPRSLWAGVTLLPSLWPLPRPRPPAPRPACERLWGRLRAAGHGARAGSALRQAQGSRRPREPRWTAVTATLDPAGAHGVPLTTAAGGRDAVTPSSWTGGCGSCGGLATC